MAILFITHDLAVVAETCDHVAVMYAGRIVEYADVVRLFEAPAHPYTKGLFSSIPSVKAINQERSDRLFVIPGMVPRPQDFPTGCRFRTRCRFATEKCKELPPLEEVENGHFAACWYAREIQAGTREPGEPHDPRSVEKETITMAGIDGSI